MMESSIGQVAASVLEARKLSHHYGPRVVLRVLDLVVRGGERIALTGANGSGKTTLLRILAGTLRPTGGEVLWFGAPAASSLDGRRLTGMVAHDSFLYPGLTLRENLLFAARMCDVPQPKQCVARWIDDAGLRRLADQATGSLSRGTRQRAALVRALLHDPALVILDEPFSGLDADGLRWCLGVIEGLRARGRTVVFSTHDPALARQSADRVLRLESGKLRADTECSACASAESPHRRAA
jgi:heme exporter protein A